MGVAVKLWENVCGLTKRAVELLNAAKTVYYSVLLSFYDLDLHFVVLALIFIGNLLTSLQTVVIFVECNP